MYVYKFGPGRYRPSAGHTRRAGGASEGHQRRELTATASAWQSRVLGLGAGHAAGGPARRVGRARTTSLRRGRQLAARREHMLGAARFERRPAVPLVEGGEHEVHVAMVWHTRTQDASREAGEFNRFKLMGMSSC